MKCENQHDVKDPLFLYIGQQATFELSELNIGKLFSYQLLVSLYSGQLKTTASCIERDENRRYEKVKLCHAHI